MSFFTKTSVRKTEWSKTENSGKLCTTLLHSKPRQNQHSQDKDNNQANLLPATNNYTALAEDQFTADSTKIGAFTVWAGLSLNIKWERVSAASTVTTKLTRHGWPEDWWLEQTRTVPRFIKQPDIQPNWRFGKIYWWGRPNVSVDSPNFQSGLDDTVSFEAVADFIDEHSTAPIRLEHNPGVKRIRLDDSYEDAAAAEQELIAIEEEISDLSDSDEE